MTLVIKYSIFAAVATLANIFTQYISIEIFYNNAYSLYIAMALGTVTGLVIKYVLDKKYIFYFTVSSLREDTKKFILYSFMGVLTTLIFWGVEILFDKLFSFEIAKFIGAVLGLTIGYVGKYKLDKKYVFR